MRSFNAPKPADVLRRARALIDTPEKWHQHWYEHNGSYCMMGAVRAATNDDAEPMEFLQKATGSNYLWMWNDSAVREHHEVLAAFDRAIALAERS